MGVLRPGGESGILRPGGESGILRRHHRHRQSIDYHEVDEKTPLLLRGHASASHSQNNTPNSSTSTTTTTATPSIATPSSSSSSQRQSLSSQHTATETSVLTTSQNDEIEQIANYAKGHLRHLRRKICRQVRSRIKWARFHLGRNATTTEDGSTLTASGLSGVNPAARPSVRKVMGEKVQ